MKFFFIEEEALILLYYLYFFCYTVFIKVKDCDHVLIAMISMTLQGGRYNTS
jgi:hypothetical protein